MTNMNNIDELSNDIQLNEEKETFDETIYTTDEILKNVLYKCKTEADNEDLEIPLSRVIERVSNYTGFSIDTVNKIYNNGNFTHQTCTIDLSGRIEIYKCLKDLYMNKIPPTYKKVYILVNKLFKLPTFAEFKNNMVFMGYNYYTASGIQMLLEDPKNTFERYLYLNKIIEIRKNNKQTVYYVDERVIDTKLTFQKPCIDEIDYKSASWNGYIILHIISGKQCVSSLYSNCLTENDFKKWICDIVLKKLNTNSVIVMDNNKLHGTFNRNSLTKYDTKENMLNWLNINNIPCTSNMHKAELYELYRKSKKRDREYDIDTILQAHGHEVLRLPSTLQDLSPTELFWGCIRSSYMPSEDIIPSMSNDILYTVKSRINSYVKKYTEETWFQFEKKISTMENQLFELDAEIENVIEDYLKIINKH